MNKECGTILKNRSEQAKDERKKLEKEALEKKRKDEEAIVASRPVTLEQIQQEVMNTVKAMVEYEASKGNTHAEINVTGIIRIGDYKTDLFDWE